MKLWTEIKVRPTAKKTLKIAAALLETSVADLVDRLVRIDSEAIDALVKARGAADA